MCPASAVVNTSDAATKIRINLNYCLICVPVSPFTKDEVRKFNRPLSMVQSVQRIRVNLYRIKVSVYAEFYSVKDYPTKILGTSHNGKR